MENNYIDIDNSRLSWIDQNKVLRSIVYNEYGEGPHVSSLKYDKFEDAPNCSKVLACKSTSVALLACGSIIIINYFRNILNKYHLISVGVVRDICMSDTYIGLLNTKNELYIIDHSGQHAKGAFQKFDGVVSIYSKKHSKCIIFNTETKTHVCMWGKCFACTHHYHIFGIYSNFVIGFDINNIPYRMYWFNNTFHEHKIHLKFTVCSVKYLGYVPYYIDSDLIQYTYDDQNYRVACVGYTIKDCKGVLYYDTCDINRYLHSNTIQCVKKYSKYVDAIGTPFSTLNYDLVDSINILASSDVSLSCSCMLVNFNMSYTLYRENVKNDKFRLSNKVLLPSDFTLYEDSEGSYI